MKIRFSKETEKLIEKEAKAIRAMEQIIINRIETLTGYKAIDAYEAADIIKVLTAQDGLDVQGHQNRDK